MIYDTPIGKYRWIENWIKIPKSAESAVGGRTHGVVVRSGGEIVIFHQANPAVLFYSSEGDLVKSWGNFPGAHGLTLVVENGIEFLWLVDQNTKQVIKTSLDGEVVMSLAQPPHPSYRDGAYVPTWLAVAEERFGGNGDLWLADGYGSSLVHRFDRTGKYLGSLDGTTGVGKFKCPHGVAFHSRGKEAGFYIADRGNARLQVYAQDGAYRRTFGAQFLNSPDISVAMGDLLIIPELVAGITVVDGEDNWLCAIGENAKVATQEGWPNDRRWITAGKFNSPHSAATDAQGNIYVVEWITGGRVIKLERI